MNLGSSTIYFIQIVLEIQKALLKINFNYYIMKYSALSLSIKVLLFFMN